MFEVLRLYINVLCFCVQNDTTPKEIGIEVRRGEKRQMTGTRKRRRRTS